MSDREVEVTEYSPLYDSDPEGLWVPVDVANNHINGLVAEAISTAAEAGERSKNYGGVAFNGYVKPVGLAVSAGLALLGGSAIADSLMNHDSSDEGKSGWSPDNLNPLNPGVAYANLDTTPTVTVTPSRTPTPDTRNCSPWPQEVLPAFQYYDPRPGLCLIYEPQSETGYFDMSRNAIVAGSLSINSGPAGIKVLILHELGNATFDKQARDAGFANEWEWIRTQPGLDYLRRVGWGGNDIPPSLDDPGWPRARYAPDEAARIYAYWVDSKFVDLMPGDRLTELQTSSRKRYDWAEAWLPRGSVNPTTGIWTPTTTVTRTPEPTATRTATVSPSPTRTNSPVPTNGVSTSAGSNFTLSQLNSGRTLIRWSESAAQASLIRMIGFKDGTSRIDSVAVPQGANQITEEMPNEAFYGCYRLDNLTTGKISNVGCISILPENSQFPSGLRFMITQPGVVEAVFPTGFDYIGLLSLNSNRGLFVERGSVGRVSFPLESGAGCALPYSRVGNQDNWGSIICAVQTSNLP